MRRRQVVLAKLGLLLDDLLDHGNDLVWANGAHNHCLLKQRNIIPLAGPWCLLEALWSRTLVNLFPSREILDKVIIKALEVFELCAEFKNSEPCLVGEPATFTRWVRLSELNLSGACHQESQLSQVKATLSDLVHDLEADQEGEQQVVSLEEGATDVLVELPCEFLDPVLSTLSFLALLDAGCFSGLESQAEDVLEEVERVLVHRVDTGHVSEHKEETTDTQTNGDVLLTNLLDSFHTLLSLGV